MNAYNPLAAMKRLEEAGLSRPHAEASASELEDSRSHLVTNERLDAAMDRMTIKLSAIVGALLTLFCTIIGTIVAIFAAH